MDGGGILKLTLYGEIQPDVNTNHLSPTSARAFREALEANPDAKTINLYINSVGGSVSEGQAIYTMLKRHTATVNVYIDGYAASMASAIAMAGDRIIMSPNSTMMIHRPSGMAYGNSAQMRKAADDLDQITDAFKQVYLLKAGDKLTEEVLDKLMEDEKFLTPSQAKEYGLCDEIAGQPKAIEGLTMSIGPKEITAKEYIDTLFADYKKQLEIELLKIYQPKEKEKGWFFNE